MFNWATLPTFAVMLLFWMLAAYILTRGPRGLVSLAAAGAEVAAAAFLLGQGMQANATTVVDWRRWERSLIWGAALAPALWYWLTYLLLIERGTDDVARYARWIARPLAILFAALAVAVTGLIYGGDLLFRWSAPVPIAPQNLVYSHFHLLEGPFYRLFLVLLIGTTAGALMNLGLAVVRAADRSQRRRLLWLLLSAGLFLLASNTLGLASSRHIAGDWAIVPSHLALGAAMLVMVWNVAAYSLLLKGQVIRRDALYFLTSISLICALYLAGLLAAARFAYSFQLLQVYVLVLVLAVVTHALVDPVRRVLDLLLLLCRGSAA